MNNYKLSVVEEIAAWKTHSEETKLYFIKCYLTGWTSEEEIHAITSRDS